jgi:hypothetical protein
VLELRFLPPESLLRAVGHVARIESFRERMYGSEMAWKVAVCKVENVASLRLEIYVDSTEIGEDFNGVSIVSFLL